MIKRKDSRKRWPKSPRRQPLKFPFGLLTVLDLIGGGSTWQQKRTAPGLRTAPANLRATSRG